MKLRLIVGALSVSALSVTAGAGAASGIHRFIGALGIF